MIEYNEKEDEAKIIIPLSGVQELKSYRNGILGMPRKIEFKDCIGDRESIENLKSVYRLLIHLSPGEGFMAEYDKIIPGHMNSSFWDAIQKGKNHEN